MKDHEVLWNKFDSDEEDELNLSKSKICQQLLDKAPEEIKHNIKLEMDLLRYIFPIQRVLESPTFKKDYFDQVVKDFLEFCDDEHLQYYKKRFEETKSNLNKWRYAFSCWLIEKKSNFIEASIESLIKCVHHHLPKKTFETIHFMLTAHSITQVYNFHDFDNKLTELSLYVFYKLLMTKNSGWINHCIGIFVSLNSVADYNLINNLITNLHREARQYRLKGLQHAEQNLLKDSIQLYSLMNLNPELQLKLQNETVKMIAESLELQGDILSKSNNALGASLWYEHAQNEFAKINNSDKIQELSIKIRDATKKIDYEVFEYKFTAPKFVLPGETPRELIFSIINYKEMIPAIPKIKDSSKNILQKNPLLNAVVRTIFNRTNPVSHPTTSEENLSSEMKTQMVRHIRLGESYLSYAVEDCEFENRLSSSDFIQFIFEFDLLDENTLGLVSKGIEQHFLGDYISSTHILIPQVEAVLRELLASKNISKLKKERGVIMENEFGGLLNKEETSNLLGVDLTEYLKIKFIDVDGINLRNDLSHGLLPFNEMNYVTSFSIIHTILLLINKSKN